MPPLLFFCCLVFVDHFCDWPKVVCLSAIPPHPSCAVALPCLTLDRAPPRPWFFIKLRTARFAIFPHAFWCPLAGRRTQAKSRVRPHKECGTAFWHVCLWQSAPFALCCASAGRPPPLYSAGCSNDQLTCAFWCMQLKTGNGAAVHFECPGKCWDRWKLV